MKNSDTIEAVKDSYNDFLFAGLDPRQAEKQFHLIVERLRALELPLSRLENDEMDDAQVLQGMEAVIVNSNLHILQQRFSNLRNEGAKIDNIPQQVRELTQAAKRFNFSLSQLDEQQQMTDTQVEQMLNHLVWQEQAALVAYDYYLFNQGTHSEQFADTAFEDFETRRLRAQLVYTKLDKTGDEETLKERFKERLATYRLNHAQHLYDELTLHEIISTQQAEANVVTIKRLLDLNSQPLFMLEIPSSKPLPTDKDVQDKIDTALHRHALHEVSDHYLAIVSPAFGLLGQPAHAHARSALSLMDKYKIDPAILGFERKEGKKVLPLLIVTAKFEQRERFTRSRTLTLLSGFQGPGL